jgi:hypothetical protein
MMLVQDFVSGVSRIIGTNQSCLRGLCIPMFVTVLSVAVDPENREHRAFFVSNAVTPSAAGTLSSLLNSFTYLLTYSMQHSPS